MTRLLPPTTDDPLVPKYKMILIGDTTVGKTSLVNAYIDRGLAENATLAATCTRVVSEIDGGSFHITIWDTAGQDTFRSLVPVYAHGAHTAILVFDQTNPSSFASLSEWHSFLTDKVGHIPWIVACNKSDLPATVDVALVHSWVKAKGVQMICTSALWKTNVHELFAAAIDSVIKQSQGVSEPIKLTETRLKREDANECC